MVGMADCSKRSRWRDRLIPSSALVLGTLTLALVGCSPRQPSPEPGSTPAQQPATKPKAPDSPDANAEVTRALASATDLFNRGENDLACEQVASAERWQRTATAETPSELERFRQACQTP
jgi:hypothetical protein